MHFHANEVLIRRRGGHFQGGMAHAEADLEGARRATAEHLVEIAQPVLDL